jgi:ribosome-associated protein
MQIHGDWMKGEWRNAGKVAGKDFGCENIPGTKALAVTVDAWNFLDGPAVTADKKAADVVLLEVRELTTLTDYFVICSGGSERQLRGIADGIVEGVKETGMRPIGREGGPTDHWLLLDFGSVVVHVMATPEREYYALEKLWSEAPLLLRVL